MRLRFLLILSCIFVLCLANLSVKAQTDPFGLVDVVYIDSTEAGPGQDVPVRFSIRNDETLGSFSIPISYNASLLTLKSISYSGSRVEHIQTKILNPSNISQINGHFVVSVMQILEDPVAIGDGLVFTALFTVSNSAQPGTILTIDTLFYPPAGEMILVESETSTTIRPDFVGGKILVSNPNRRPIINSPGTVYVLEGETLAVDFSAIDPDNDDLIVAITSKPSGAVYINNGDGSGQLSWTPDFVGPNSSDGSPFVFSIWASDGDLSTEEQVYIQVVNRNRNPVITAPSIYEVDAGRMLSLSVRANDPDFEPVTWEWSTALLNASFVDGNPALLNWQSELTDTGMTDVEFIATDPFGFSDTSVVTIKINSATIYKVELDTLEMFPGDEFIYNVSIDNMVPIGGFNLLFNYDKTVFGLMGYSVVGTRSESFEYFSVSYDENSVAGNTRIVGIVDIGGNDLLLPVGSGSIVKFTMVTSSNLAYSGMTVPFRFRFLDSPQNNDNTMTDSTGLQIEQTAIIYREGFVRIGKVGDIKIGDINLNGLASEISDVIYFTNYFINPVLYPFSAIQFANSDLNMDGILASISDLVALINQVVNGQSSKALISESIASSAIGFYSEDETVVAKYSTESEIGAVYISIRLNESTDQILVRNPNENMILDYQIVGDKLNIIVYSWDGFWLPRGENELVVIDGLGDFEIDAVELSTPDGQMIAANLVKSSASLPGTISLHQNYPNPFNPTTSISFDIPRTLDVRLEVFNILGQSVKMLVNEMYPAGSFNIKWDGTDESGNTVASGLYLYRLETDTESISRKMILIK